MVSIQRLCRVLRPLNVVLQVENHHHYPITAVSVPANGYGFNIQSETPTDFTKAPKGEEDHPALDFAEKNDDHRTTASEALPSPVPLGKPPLRFVSLLYVLTAGAGRACSRVNYKREPSFSYRDVAAKIDQCACENVPPVSQVATVVWQKLCVGVMMRSVRITDDESELTYSSGRKKYAALN